MLMEFTPTLLWSQTYEDIEIEINLPSISNEILRVENNVFHFECLAASNKKYLIDFELDDEISETSVSIQNDKKMIVVLKKKEEGVKWDFLAKKRGIYKNNIKINWDKWENSEDEEDVKNINMDGMGGGMGGGMDMSMGGGMDMNMLQEMMANMGNVGENSGEEDGEDQDEEDGEDQGEE